jgi:enoyl-CoA hydratase/carnithine racemase
VLDEFGIANAEIECLHAARIVGRDAEERGDGMYETLKIEKVDGHAVLTLNRPEAVNALSPQLIREVATAFAEFQADRAVQVVILTGAGRAFCAGLDTKHLAQSGTNAFDLKTFDLPEIIEQFPGPVIAAINGLAFTGGFEIALACDVIIAAASASFVDGHSPVGLMPGWGLSQRLPRTIGLYRAKELTLTGRALSGRQPRHGSWPAAASPTAS